MKRFFISLLACTLLLAVLGVFASCNTEPPADETTEPPVADTSERDEAITFSADPYLYDIMSSWRSFLEITIENGVMQIADFIASSAEPPALVYSDPIVSEAEWKDKIGNNKENTELLNKLKAAKPIGFYETIEYNYYDAKLSVYEIDDVYYFVIIQNDKVTEISFAELAEAQ